MSHASEFCITGEDKKEGSFISDAVEGIHLGLEDISSLSAITSVMKPLSSKPAPKELASDELC